MENILSLLSEEQKNPTGQLENKLYGCSDVHTRLHLCYDPGQEVSNGVFSHASSVTVSWASSDVWPAILVMS